MGNKIPNFIKPRDDGVWFEKNIFKNTKLKKDYLDFKTSGHDTKYTDKIITENFNTYRFADYKLHVIDLLKRVCTVSVETGKIIEKMEK